MRRILGILIAIILLTSSVAFAAKKSAFDIKAYIPTTSQLSVAISKVVGTTWTTQSSVDFGTLTWDNTYKIYRANCYYAVDVGVVDNASSFWSLQHTCTLLSNGTDNLNNNVNVVFMNQTSDTKGSELGKYSYTNSNGKSYTKSQVTGWLRIHYGLASGKNDASGVVPIGANKSSGQYTGTITLTLTP